MKGLLIKDLINLKRQARVLAVMVVFYIILSVTSDNSYIFGGIIAILCSMLPITALSYDERAKWDKYVLSMPVSRTELVVSKYLLGVLLTGVAFFIIVVYSLFMSHDSLGTIFLSALLMCVVGLFFLSLILPLMFRFGVEKGRILMLLVYIVPVGAVMLLSRLGLPEPSTADFMNYALYFVGVTVVFFFLSMALSAGIYRRKEF